MPTDTNLQQLIINELTKAQYDALTTKNENELYFITDDNTFITNDALTEALSNYYTKQQIDEFLANLDLLPSQTGNEGKFLSTNGTSVSWEKVDALPDQTGQAGKVLTTDGTNASWQESTGGGQPTIFRYWD